MFVVFEPAHESELLPGEVHSVTLLNQASPLVGSKVSLKGEPRWTVLDVDTYRAIGIHPTEGETDLICVAHCAVNVQAAGDRSTWREVQRGKEREINLVLSWGDGQDLGVAWNFTGRSPQVGEVLQGFDVAAHTVHARPWKIASVQEFKSVEFVCYTKVYLALCEAIELAAAV